MRRRKRSSSARQISRSRQRTVPTSPPWPRPCSRWSRCVAATGAILVADGEFGFGAIIAATILSGKAIAPFAQLFQLLVRLSQIG